MQLKQFYDIATKVSCRKKCYYFWWSTWLFSLSNRKPCHAPATVLQPPSQECVTVHPVCSWWRHQMETFSALLALCAGNSPVTGEFPAQRPVTQSFDVFFYLRLHKRLCKQSWGWWFETQSSSLWRHCNVSNDYFEHTATKLQKKADIAFPGLLNAWCFLSVENKQYGKGSHDIYLHIAHQHYFVEDDEGILGCAQLLGVIFIHADGTVPWNSYRWHVSLLFDILSKWGNLVCIIFCMSCSSPKFSSNIIALSIDVSPC